MSHTVKNLKLLYEDIEKHSSKSSETKKRLINLLSLVLIPTLIFYAYLNFILNQKISAFISLFLVFGILFLTYSINFFKNKVFVIKTLAVFIISTPIIVLYLTQEEFNFYMVFIIPSLIFYLVGRRIGLYLLSLFLIGIYAYYITVLTDIQSIADFKSGVFDILSSFLTLIIVDLIIVSNLEESENNLEKKSEELYKAVVELVDEVWTRKVAEKNLNEKVKEISVKNTELEEAKSVLSNALNDVKQAKILTERELAKTSALIESIGEGIIALDDEEEIILINDQTLDLLGRKQKDVIGKKITEVLSVHTINEEKIDLAFIPHTMVSSSREKHEGKYKIINSKGEFLPVYMTITPIIRSDALSGVMIVFRDITREEEVDRAKTEFVSLASHQLKTPLAIIKWYLELLTSDKKSLSAEQIEFIDSIGDAVMRMNDLIASLLNVSRLDMGTMEVEPQMVSLKTLMLEEIESLKVELERKNLILNTRLDPEINSMFDPGLFKIIINNFLTNAIKYTPEGGEITIDTELSETEIRISISDTGLGIPKDQQDKIFTKMFRAENVKHTDASGSGLGLYIVKSIIEKSGGNVMFKSEEGRGTQFIVTYPHYGMRKSSGNKLLQ